MRILWFISFFLWHVGSYCQKVPWIEKYHYPGYYSTPITPFINGTDTEVVSSRWTPEYRVEEKMFVVYNANFKKERERPYRLSPHYKQIYYWEPLYKYDYEVNVSHPIPCMYDLSIWAATYRFDGYWFSYSGAVLCYRAASGWFEYASSIPRQFDLSVVVGYQFMKAYHRRPMPWYKYGVKTKSYVWPCPKSDWHWFHCIQGEYWGRFGFDSGGAMHLMMEKKSYRVDGLAGLCAFSMKLRSVQTTHYFTVVDTYKVLDFMYDAYLGLIPCSFLDERFQDTKWGAPIVWSDVRITPDYTRGFGEYDVEPIPYYRR